MNQLIYDYIIFIALIEEIQCGQDNVIVLWLAFPELYCIMGASAFFFSLLCLMIALTYRKNYNENCNGPISHLNNTIIKITSIFWHEIKGRAHWFKRLNSEFLFLKITQSIIIVWTF